MKALNAITCALVVVAVSIVFEPSYASSSNSNGNGNSGNNSSNATNNTPAACTAQWYDWLLTYVGAERKGLTCT
jgi:hypothetical protein